MNIDNYSDIKYHIKTSLGLLKNIQNNIWYQSFCPFCNDRTRKNNPNHGHLYISKINSYYKCFRCDTFGKLSKLLDYTNFNNQILINTIKKQEKTSLTYGLYIKNTIINNIDIYEQLKHIYIQFYQNNLNDFNKFVNYINSRCLDINPIKFLIFPAYVNNGLACGFMNYNANIITYRYIFNKKIRYFKTNTSWFYYFQNMDLLYTVKNVVICEGAFDLINLYNFMNFKNSFYIAANGKFFNKVTQYLILNYLLIGEYRFHIIYDNDQNFNHKQSSSQLKKMINKLNPNCKCSFYMPSISKDVSDLMMLSKL